MDQLEAACRAALDRSDWPEALRLGQLLDAQPAPAPVSLIGAALWYAEQGWPVLALRPGSKRPATRHGLHDATIDPNQIRGWWQTIPQANIGLLTGVRFDVIDVDGPLGVTTWLHTQDLPPIYGQVSTPRPGGHHLYISATGDANGTQILPGLDYRGKGGYVVAPPSVITDGPHPGRYTWVRGLQLPAVTP